MTLQSDFGPATFRVVPEFLDRGGGGQMAGGQKAFRLYSLTLTNKHPVEQRIRK